MRRTPLVRVLDRDVLLAHLRDLAQGLGKTPSGTDILNARRHSPTSYYKYFGTLREAHRQAGLRPNPNGRHCWKYRRAYR